ncbi:MAG: patatin-like phospholipase family protein [Clostridia bacterium]|nr:patatin-like phospholipase family protein [Clostridia bacterium]
MKIGLVLSGGLAKGAYQIGALRAICEYFKPEDIEYISSSSVGALNAYAFSSDNLEVGARMWEELTPGDEKKLVTKVMKSDYLKGCTLGLAQKHVLSKKQYVSVFRLKEMDVLYVDVGHKEPDEAALYLQAAVAMPVFSRAVKINKKKYYDGGTIDNIPVFPLLKHNLDYIICIYFDEYFSFEKTDVDDKIIKITFGRDEKVMANSIWFTKEGTERMMQEGYERAKEVLDRVFAEGTDNLPKIYGHIKELDDEHPERKLRVTVDVAIGCLNKMAKFISKRKIID